MRYGIHSRLIKGRRISLFLTMRCNLRCSYCSLKAGGDFPLRTTDKAKELSWEEWMPVLDNLFKFIDISEVIITGGEPTLRWDLGLLVNFILDKGKCVVLHSNLATQNGMTIKQTNRFRILSTYHRQDNKGKYLKMYKMYARKYKVDATEIEDNQLDVTRSKPFEKQGAGLSGMTERFAIAPDGYMFASMPMFFKHLRGEK